MHLKRIGSEPVGVSPLTARKSAALHKCNPARCLQGSSTARPVSPASTSTDHATRKGSGRSDGNVAAIDLFHAEQLGVARILSKPFPMVELQEALRAALA
jgi:hypothetical protein